MNALVNSQFGELEKFLCHGYPQGQQPVTFEKYTGQESDEKKQQIIGNPPDILITNYVMLEMILTRIKDRPLIKAAKDMRSNEVLLVDLDRQWGSSYGGGRLRILCSQG